MDRRTGDEWSGDPLLLAALKLYAEQMLGELPSEEQLSVTYGRSPRLDQMIWQMTASLRRQ